MTTIGPQASRYEGVVDLRRYPINDPAGPGYRALVQACQDQLRDTGVAQLAGFHPGRGQRDACPGQPAGLPGVGERPGSHRLFRACR